MTSTPVLLAYDASPDADRALRWAAAEARSLDAPLVVMAVEDVQPVPMVTPARHGIVEPVPSWVPAALDRARSSLAGSGLEVTCEHRVGRVVSGLVEAANAASVAVLGSRGHGPVGEAILGSVSNDVARHAACPVVVVREPHDPTSRRIVVGIDGSPGSRAALAYACRRAERTGETVTAVHGWHVHAPSTDVWSALPRTLADEEGRRLLLAESVAGVREDHPDVPLELEAIAVDPATSLVGASSSASLVVVGSRGLGLVGGLLLGSVSQDVLHRARCPVAVVR